MELSAFFLGRGPLQARPPPSSFIPPQPPTPASLFFHHALLYFHLRSSQGHCLALELRAHCLTALRSTPPSHPGDAHTRSPSSRRRDVTPRGRRRARGRGRGAGWPAGGGAEVQLRASAAIAACAFPSTRRLPALPGRVGPRGIRSLTPRDTAASGAGPPSSAMSGTATAL